MTEHKQYDDLESWIYARIAYTDANPLERIDFLMRTQQEAWRSYKNMEERQAWFDLLALQGYYQLQNGNILASISAYEKALEFYEAYPLPGVDVIENVLKPLGNNYTRLADYKTALYIHRKTLALARDHAPTLASVYANMAVCARWQGDLPTAIQYCINGLTYVSKQHALYGLLLSTLADILSEQGKYDTAFVVVRQALRQLQSKNEPAWYAITLQIASTIARKQGNYKQALSFGKQALQRLPPNRIREKAKLLVLLGDIYNSMYKAQQALNCHQQALQLLIPSWQAADPLANKLYGENTLADALNGSAQAYTTLQQPRQALNCYLASFAVERKLRKEFFYTESKLRELQVTRSRIEAAMKLAYRLQKTDQLLLIAEISRAQVLMDERRWRMQQASFSDTLEQKLKQLQNAIVYYQQELLQTANKQHIQSLLQTTEYELLLLNKKLKQQDDDMLTVQALQKMFKTIPAHVTVLEFFAGRDTSFIIELNRAGIQQVYSLPANDSLQAFMQYWFANGPSNMINHPRRFYDACHAVYQSIFSHYSWKKGNHYLLMTDGLFNYLPYDALITEPGYRNNYRDWPYLCKQVSLSQAYSLQTWYEQQTTHYASAPFSAFFVSKGTPLAVEEEYKLMRQQFGGQFFINQTATHSAFNAVIDSTAILHISTHAISSAVDSFPYLQLFDKPYYLFDLRYKQFSPALVVLGACKTADGVLLEGEGVNSIGRGFTAAGAGGIVSGLWNVHDRAAIDMMQHFYTRLSSEANPALALHKAKQAWLQTSHASSFLHLPYYWAGLVYSGHLQKVQLEIASSSRQWIYWLAAGLVLIVAPAILKIFYRSPV
jgi:Uncharacterized protein conserved in bacteria